jgi:hypothetical protein
MIDSSPIIITGVPRSGSSIVAGIVNLCGAFGGDMRLHPGVYENGAIQRLIENAYLESNGFDVMGQYPLPGDMNTVPLNWKKLISMQLLAEGYKKGVWMYKSARAGLLWRVWNHTYPNAKWLIVRRRTGDIIESCMKTGYMSAFKSPENCEKIGVATEEEGWLWMIHEYEKRFVDMMTEGVNCKVVWPERMVNGDYRQIYEALDWIGLPWKPQVLTLADELLNTSRKKERRT